MRKFVGIVSLFGLLVSGCSVLDAKNFSLPADYNNLSDYKKFGFSLTKELNEGEWDDGTKVSFSNPHSCGSYEGSYYCDFMAVIEDVRGKQGCVNLEGRKSKDGSISYQSDSDTSCRWLDGAL